MPGEIAGFGDRFAQLARRDALDQERIQRPGEIGGHPQVFRRPFPSHQRRQPQQALERLDRRRNRLAFIDAIKGLADTLVEFGVPNRDQPGKQQPAAARLQRASWA